MSKYHDIPIQSRDDNDRLNSMLDRFFASIGQGFNAYLAARSRIAEVERLDARTDAELATMGLKREDIPRHVFRDILHT